MQILIHAGLPKTGSTTLQKFVLPALEGVSFSTVYDSRRASVALNLDRLNRARDRRTLADIATEHARLVAGRSGPLLISNENFTFARKSDWRSVPARLREAAGEARIVLVVREQLAWIESYYFFHQRKNVGSGRLVLPQQFVECEIAAGDNGAFAVTRYDELVALWEEAFGADMVSVVPYEWMRERPRAFFLPFAQALRRDADEFADALARAPRLNQRISNDRFYAGLHHTVLRRRFGVLYKIAHKLGFTLESAGAFDASPARFDFAPLVPPQVDAGWRRSNAALARSRGLDLAALGYRL